MSRSLRLRDNPYKCWVCMMSFRTTKPIREVEILRCPDCEQRFWTYKGYSSGGTGAVVGIFPEDRKMKHVRKRT